MKKKKIGIIKNNDLMNHRTFFNNPHSVAFEPANTYLESKRDDRIREKLTDKDKKKKVANKKDNASSSLKYINPSQRITPRFTNNSCMLM
jgi:hypothetical protein